MKFPSDPPPTEPSFKSKSISEASSLACSNSLPDSAVRTNGGRTIRSSVNFDARILNHGLQTRECFNCARLGDGDQVCARLEKACGGASLVSSNAQGKPDVDSYRSARRFGALLRRIGLQ